MEKIALRAIKLVNWYGFISTTIPVADDLTFITGENESGKSTILDAFKYAYLGDTVFNRSSGSSNRTLYSYTRCLIDSTEGLYARPADRFPTVYTHIALEFYDKLNNEEKILGVIIETSSTNETTARRYVMKNVALSDISFTYEKEGVLYPFSISDFRNTYKVAMYDVKDGVAQFSRETGLRLSDQGLNEYRRRLRQLMTYKPEAKIADFMKSYVLDSNPVDLSKLKISKQNIDTIKNDLNNIQTEIDKLDKVLDLFHTYDLTSRRVLQDDIRILLINKKEAEFEFESCRSEDEKLSLELEECRNQIQTIINQKDKIDDELIEARMLLNANDAGRAVEEERKILKELLQREAAAEENAEKLHRFQEIVDSILTEYSCSSEESNTVARNLEIGAYSVAEKTAAVSDLRSVLTEKRDDNTGEKAILNRKLRENETKRSVIDNRIEALEKGRIDYARLSKQQKLIEEINAEFEKRRINSKARMAFEFVLAVKDPDWQDVIEAFLGRHRYAILVEPQYFNVANEILDRMGVSEVELIRSRALNAMEVEPFDDAVSSLLEIKDPLASKYFSYLLGKIHAVDNKEVDKYDSALSKEGKISRNLTVSYIDLSKLKEYCLGLDAAKKTIALLKQERDDLDESDRRDYSAVLQIEGENTKISNYLEVFTDYDYSAAVTLARTKADVIQAENNVKELEEALRDNSEYIALAERVSRIEQDSNKLKTERDRLETQGNKTSDKIRENGISLEKANARLKSYEQSLLDMQDSKTGAREYIQISEKRAIDELKGEVLSEETKRRYKNDCDRLAAAQIPASQAEYNLTKRNEDLLPVGLDCEFDYSERQKKLKIDDFAEVQKKLDDQLNQFQRVFKKEFCAKIHSYVEDNIYETRKISRELHNLNFTTKYDLSISRISDGSDFDKILQYGDYLAKTSESESNNISLFDTSGYSDEEIDNLENEVIAIIESVISDNNENRMSELSDYRNYLTYEVIINGDGIVNGKLSSQIGYASGAATQIPYLLILSAALSMFYRSKENCSRIIFIDEPFDKMSDDNIKQMLDFFKEQQFQAILCAPTNKLDSIGEECDCIVPVRKYSKDRMIVGKEKWKNEV